MTNHEQWSSKIAFILAAAGSAIGLGAIWKFPYMAGMNGGGVFFLLFLIFTIFLGAPMLLAEFVIGRRSQKDAVDSYRTLAPNSKWHYVGYLGVVTSFLLLSFYSVVGGWILSYLFRSLTGQLSNLSNDGYGQLFNSIIANPWEVPIAQFIFMLLTIFVVQNGVKKGIETASKYMMPALFILFIVLVIRSLTLEGAMEGVKFLLSPDFSKLTAETVIMALGQAFFALSVGISVMVTYSSYLPKSENLPRSVTSVVSLNILISLLAGLAIFPAVFALGFNPSAGPELIFIIFPAVFDKIAFGGFFFAIFLILLLFATLTSAFSILEIVVASVAKDDTEKRRKSSWIIGLLVFITGIPSALSFGLLGEFTLFGKVWFDFADYLCSNILLPLGGLLIALFVSRRMSKESLFAEVNEGGTMSASLFAIWYNAVRYLLPIGIILIFLNAVGLI
ncbi:sodium-dependent transporter [Bacillus tianshenii]|nr:sodium-dependent transporter [Bacillus tianshenii]